MWRTCNWLSAAVGLSAALVVFAGCDVTITPNAGATDPGNNDLRQIGVGAHQPGVAPDGSVRGIPTITDGTSNTLQIGENAAAPGNTSPASDPAAPSPNAPTAPSATPSPGPSPDDLKAITVALGDKQITLGNSSGNSDNNAFLTSTTDITLCAFGRFGRVETTSFSSSVGDSETSVRSNGTWRVGVVNSLPVLELSVESSTDPKQQPVEQVSIATDASGNLFLNGRSADIKDASGNCAAAQANP